MASITSRSINRPEASISVAITILSKAVKVALNAIVTFSNQVLEALDNKFTYYAACYEALYLRCFVRVDKIAIQVLNHGRDSATSAEVTALEKGIQLNIGAVLSIKRHGIEATTRGLDVAQLIGIQSDAEAISTHIAHAKECTPLSGLCLGYAWLFGTFLLTQKAPLSNPDHLLKKFNTYEHLDKTLLLSFLGNFNYTEMIQVPDANTVRILNETELKRLNNPACRAAVWAKAGSKIIGNWIQKHIDPKFTATALKNETSIEPSTVDRSSIKKDLLKAYETSDGCPLVIATKEHAMTVYASKKDNHYLFFDPSFGIQSYNSLEELASGVEFHIKQLTKQNVLFSIHKLASSE